jgi:hypothetical protein
MEKFKLLGRPTCRCSARTHTSCSGLPIRDLLCPLTPATVRHLPSLLCHRPMRAVLSSVGRCQEHVTQPPHLSSKRQLSWFPFPICFSFSPLTPPKQSHLPPRFTGERRLHCTSNQVLSHSCGALWVGIGARDPPPTAGATFLLPSRSLTDESHDRVRCPICFSFKPSLTPMCPTLAVERCPLAVDRSRPLSIMCSR